MNNLPAINAIIFDFDDTLVDSFNIIYQAYYETSTHFNLVPVKTEQLRNTLHHSTLFADHWEDAQKLYLSYYHEYSAKLTPYKHSEEILKLLKNNNIKSIIISNKRGSILRHEINNVLNWNHYFDLIIAGDDTSECKPSISPVKYASSYLNFRLSKNVWFVGDSLIDIECANLSGCTSVLIGEMTNQIIQSQYKPSLHFNNHKEILEAIKGVL